MIDFFTPVQVSSSTQGLTDQYEVDKYKNDPFMPAVVKIQSLGDHRKKIIQWLKSMPIASRINKLTFTNKQFACLLMSMFQKIQDKSRDCLREFGISFCHKQGFKINQERFLRKADPNLLEAQQKLINSIIVVNRYSRFDSVTVDSSLASDINYLFDLFDIIENGVSHQLTINNYQNYTNPQNPHIIFYNSLQYDSSITKSLGTWFVEAIKKNVSVQYFKQCEEKRILNCQHGIQNIELYNINTNKNQITQIFKQKSKDFKKYWKNLTQVQRQVFIDKILKNDIRDTLSEYRQTIKVSNDSFPNIKYSHPYHIKHFVQELAFKDGECLLNQLVFTRIYEVLYEIATYKYQIMIQVQNQIQKKKREENFIIMRKKINKGLKVIKTTQNNKVNHQKVFIIQQQDKSPRSQKSKKNVPPINLQKSASMINNGSQHIQQQGEAQTQQKLKTPKNNNKKPKKKKTKKHINKDSSFQGCKQMSETTNDQDDEDENKQKILEVYLQQNKKLESTIQLTKVLKQFSQKMSTWNKYQQIALNRVASILHSYNLSYQLFGSFANGLAISSSDIDISIDPTIVHYFYGNFCSYKQKIIMALQFLRNCFQTLNWATNFNLVTTASVPVLAFQIDLSICFGNHKDLLFNVAKNRKGPKICVDITIQPFANTTKQVMPHLGLDSTALVREWISEYSNLGQLIKICKHILNKQKLNKSFTGGLSSYALTTILYSFLRADESRKQKALHSLFLEFCQFVINFNENSTIIELTNIVLFQERQFQKLTVLNCLNGKNLTENCYKFSNIKQVFKNIKDAIQKSQQKNKQYTKKIRAIFLQ